MKNTTTLFLLCILFITCKPIYLTSDFDFASSPEAPDYSDNKDWAVLPSHWPEELEDVVGPHINKEADVFYIYPTLFTDKKDAGWNSNIRSSKIRNEILSKAIAFQASAWTKAANLYAPFYRQAHYRIFVDPYSSQGNEAGYMAYDDVKRAFIYYLENYNAGKPIIIAAHSQGSMHAKRLVHDFFDETPLQEKLVAAYLIGVKISPNEFKNIHPLEIADATGGFVSWNSYRKNRLPKRYESWYKGGVVTNPITWDAQNISNKKDHLGVLYSDYKVYSKSIEIERIDGMLWASVPKIPNRFLLSFVKNYHFADINLFWADIQKNAQLRVSSWLKKYKK